MPLMGGKNNTQINFSEITFEKCKNPEHSHPPLSQKETKGNEEELINSDLNSYFAVNCLPKYFKVVVEKIFEKPDKFPELFYKHFPPSRSPPYLEV